MPSTQELWDDEAALADLELDGGPSLAQLQTSGLLQVPSRLTVGSHALSVCGVAYREGCPYKTPLPVRCALCRCDAPYTEGQSSEHST
jgi:hypothetical protein